jgi:hypothetical protein
MQRLQFGDADFVKGTLLKAAEGFIHIGINPCRGNFAQNIGCAAFQGITDQREKKPDAARQGETKIRRLQRNHLTESFWTGKTYMGQLGTYF